MNIVDILIQLLNFLVQKLLLPILPVNIPFYPLEQLKATLSGLGEFMANTFGGLGVFLPVLLALTLLIVVVIAEMTLFSYSIVKYVVEFLRGK